MSDAVWAALVAVLAVCGSQGWLRLKLRARFPNTWRAVARLTGGRAGGLFAACGLRRPGTDSRWASLVRSGDADLPTIISVTPTAAGADVLVHPAVGQAPSAVADAAERLGAALGVPIVARLQRAGSVIWSLRATDPLDGHQVREPLRPLEHRVPGFYLGLSEELDELHLDLANTSGVVVAGTPGAGKTAALTRWVAQLCASIPLAVMLIDGKGSGDWSPFMERATLLVNDGRLESAVGVLEAATDVMEHRLLSAPTLLGGAVNYWDADVDVRPPLLLVIIDECQTLFASAGSKDDKALSARCVVMVSDLVRRGRSAGVVVVCATQRPTVDAIPGQIRDNASARISFRVMTADAARAVLGAEFDPAVSPIGAPTGVGVALADGLAATRFRVPYATPRETSEFVDSQGGSRIELADLAPGLAYDVPLTAQPGEDG